MEIKKQPQHSSETPLQAWHWFWQQIQSVQVRSVKGSFQRLQGRAFRTWAVTAAQMTSHEDKSVHYCDTSSWVEESALPSWYELALEVIENDCFCLVLWATSPSPLNMTFYIAMIMSHKTQEKDSMLGKACYEH